MGKRLTEGVVLHFLAFLRSIPNSKGICHCSAASHILFRRCLIRLVDSAMIP